MGYRIGDDFTPLVFQMIILFLCAEREKDSEVQRQKDRDKINKSGTKYRLCTDFMGERVNHCLFLVSHRRVSGVLGRGADEEGGDNTRPDGVWWHRQRWEAQGFKPAARWHRCQVTWVCACFFSCLILYLTRWFGPPVTNYWYNQNLEFFSSDLYEKTKCFISLSICWVICKLRCRVHFFASKIIKWQKLYVQML